MKKKKTVAKKKTVRKKTVEKKTVPVQEILLEDTDYFEDVEADALKKILKKALTKKKDFDLDTLNESEMNALLKVLIGYIYETHEIKSVVYKGLEYYNQPNQWNDTEPPDSVHDPLTRCTGYEECEFEEGKELVRISPKKGEKIKYNIGRIELDADDDSILFQIDKVFGRGGIIHSKSLVLIYDDFNDDHRGSDHTRIILDFPEEVTLKPSLTKMEDFTDALFRLRSHKFENNYEMYFNTNTKVKKNEIQITLDFDHGS